MTGNNLYHSYAPWGVWGAFQPSPIKKTDMTLGRLMKKAGYNTGFLGKWHMGGDWNRKDNPNKIYRGPRHKPEMDVDITQIVGNGPKDLGFDYSFMYPAGIQATPYAAYENQKWYPLSKKSKIGKLIDQDKMDKIKIKLDKLAGQGDSKWNPFLLGKLLVNKAVDYLNENAKKEKPFFMYYCAQAVHFPHAPAGKINNIKIKGTTPTYHIDMIKELDVQVGFIVETLKKQGVYDNTLLIFASDNGGLGVRNSREAGHRTSDIYSGAKGSIQEGGHRTPFIAVWPGKIKPKIVSNELISAQDILSTLAKVTDQKLEETHALDSNNLLPMFFNEESIKGRTYMITQGGSNKQYAYREGNLKLTIQFDKKDKTWKKKRPIGLFDLSKTVKENNNTNLIDSEAHKEIVKRMFAAFNKIRDNKLPTRSL